MKLVKNETYLLLIDEEAEIISQEGLYTDGINIFSLVFYPEKVLGKIIAYRKLNEEAKELDLPSLPPFEYKVDLREIALTIYKEPLNKNGEARTQLIGSIGTPFGFNKWFKAFKIGYKVAQQSNKQFSLEDMKKAFEYYAFTSVSNQPYNDSELEEQFEKFIKSLSTQQLPVGFIPEPNDVGFIKNADIIVGKKLYDKIMSPFKTITNSDGKQEIQGYYIW